MNKKARFKDDDNLRDHIMLICKKFSGSLDGGRIVRLKTSQDELRILTLIGNDHFQFTFIDWEQARPDVMGAYIIALISVEAALEIELIFPSTLRVVLDVLDRTEMMLGDTREMLKTAEEKKGKEGVERMQEYCDIIKINREVTRGACEDALARIKKGGK